MHIYICRCTYYIYMYIYIYIYKIMHMLQLGRLARYCCLESLVKIKVSY